MPSIHNQDILFMYTEPLPDYGDLMTRKEFHHACLTGQIMSYDGQGYAVRNNLMAHEPLDTSRNIPEDATHIMWFNK